MGATSSIPRSMVASIVYASDREGSDSESRRPEPRRKVEVLGIIGLVIALIALFGLIFLKGTVPLVGIGLLALLAFLLGLISLIVRRRNGDSPKVFSTLSLGFGYVIAVFALLFMML